MEDYITVQTIIQDVTVNLFISFVCLPVLPKNVVQFLSKTLFSFSSNHTVFSFGSETNGQNSFFFHHSFVRVINSVSVGTNGLWPETEYGH